MPIVKLKVEWGEKIIWVGAHSLFVMAEAIAFITAFKEFKLHQPLIEIVVLPLCGLLPWLTGFFALQRYRNLTEPKMNSGILRDVSFQLGSMVLSAYLLFIMAITVLDLAK